MEVLREGYRIPFRRAPVLSREPIPFPANCPNTIRGKALEQKVASLLQKGAIEPAPLPVHPKSRKFLRFVVFGRVYQFKTLCFGLATAPQVFTRVMAPVSAILHSLGIRLRRYLDDWLIQASSREQVLLSLRAVLRLCNSLGIVVNWEKFQLVLTQTICYLGVLLDSINFRASPAQKRIDKLLSIGDVFLSSVDQPAKSWLVLLGVLPL